MTIRRYSSISQDTTLAAAINSADTSMTVVTGTGATLVPLTLTAGDIFTVAIDVDTVNEEIVYVTARTTDTLYIQRGQAGTNATSHAQGATVQHVLSSADLDWFNNMIQSSNSIGNTPTVDGGTP